MTTNGKTNGHSLPAVIVSHRPVLITGGAGFIGTNVAHRLLSAGKPVEIFDNLSRPGVERNLRWLQEKFPNLLRFTFGDVRDGHALAKSVHGADQIFHFASQVAVTTSIKDPVFDFDVNVRGTMNMLEALRSMRNPPPLVFTSTNKVYGQLENMPLRENRTRHEPTLHALRLRGVGEEQPLNFHSPYGCSKGAADQYILDSARTYGIPAVVFRMSCIYGPHQFGTEDQGWVAHFLIKAFRGEPLTLYGDGKQVRDVLYIDDLVDAFLTAQNNMHVLRGSVFNIGGGPAHTISLIELLDIIQELHGAKPHVEFGDWRVGDQKYYVSNIRRFRERTGWSPKVGVRVGVRSLYNWLLDQTAAQRIVTLPKIGVAP